ncbi:hypothetical protein, partial [Brevibacillus sp. MCWH]|uniref:hypothetical protein n=1 Tax=Brevibacillus sp. MCWH TaxID=2508871 RepID=UPI001C0F168C
ANWLWKAGKGRHNAFHFRFIFEYIQDKNSLDCNGNEGVCLQSGTPLGYKGRLVFLGQSQPFGKMIIRGRKRLGILVAGRGFFGQTM